MKILVATDGSEFGRAAVKKCCEFAGRPEKVSVMVISVYEPQGVIAPEPFAISGEYYRQMSELAEQNARDAADQSLRLIAAECPNANLETTSIVELGRPAEVILRAARAWNADLIILGSHGRGFWGRLTLGSVSDAVVHHAKCSVLIVKGGEE